MTDLCRNKPLKKIKIKIESYYYFPVFPCHQYQSVLQALEQINHILLIKKKKKSQVFLCAGVLLIEHVNFSLSLYMELSGTKRRVRSTQISEQRRMISLLLTVMLIIWVHQCHGMSSEILKGYKGGLGNSLQQVASSCH